MISFLLYLLRSFLTTVIVGALCYWDGKLNMKREQRSKQFLLPPIAMTYSIIAVCLVHSLNEWMTILIRQIPTWIGNLGAVSWMPGFLSEWLTGFSQFLNDLLQTFALNYWILCFSNIAIFLGFLIIKHTVVPILRRVIHYDGFLHKKISEKFYENDPGTSDWSLKEKYIHVRTLLMVLFIASQVIAVILMIISLDFYRATLLNAAFYPVFWLIVLGEVFFYFRGYSKKEKSSLSGKEDNAQSVGSYALIRKFLRTVFGDRLNAENTSVLSFSESSEPNDVMMEKLLKNEDSIVRPFALFMKDYLASGGRIDQKFTASTIEMLHEKSILFNNPFYYDMIPYVFYPMNRSLLQHKKVLVILGRHAIEKDIETWVKEGITSVTGMDFLWEIGILGKESNDLDIGIMSRSDILNLEFHESISDFLSQVGFCVIIEPSKLILTAQIGLNIIARKCNEKNKVTYCLCDKNCDGLVDASSHVLMTSITEVSATPKHTGVSSYMCWDVGKEYMIHRLMPNISRYLGFGTELSIAGLKNQVSSTIWYGGDAFPVKDMEWIAHQYYYDLTSYAGLPANQEALSERFHTSFNFWNAQVKPKNYMTVEDESFNAFEVVREFATRTTEQGFVNVISTDYLLKDYMMDNQSIFETDAKAIPYISADYVRTRRNTILRLLLQMATYPVAHEKVIAEFSLIGIKVFDLKKQLWFEIYRLFGDSFTEEFYETGYKEAVETIFDKKIILKEKSHREFSSDVICVKERYNFELCDTEVVYSLDNLVFHALVIDDLKSASYIAEDEKGEKYYLGAELRGHIFQKYLPGQYFTFAGKYYEMQSMTADGQVLVRRAADHIDGRPVYRQLREYTLSNLQSINKLGESKDISGLRIEKKYADIRITTPAYYRMEEYGDFSTAKKVTFEGENSQVPVRFYRKKEILQIELPDDGVHFRNNVRYLITVLFNEIFRTLFAENQAYIVAVTSDAYLDSDELCYPLTYSIHCDVPSEDNLIFIIEDSQLDLGLLVAVERNLKRIFEIMTDYLAWHLHVERLQPQEKAEPATEESTDTEEKAETEQTEEDSPETNEERNKQPKKEDKSKKKGCLSGIFTKPKKGKGEPQEEPPQDESPQEDTEPQEPTPENPAPEETPKEDSEKGESEEDASKQEVSEDTSAGEELHNKSTLQEEGIEIHPPKEKEDGEEPEQENEQSVKRIAGQEKQYLTFGYEFLQNIDAEKTYSYLAVLGFNDNFLREAREKRGLSEQIRDGLLQSTENQIQCDFCGRTILGAEYEVLADGRDRCMICSSSAVKTVEELEKIFSFVFNSMESFFGIVINKNIKVVFGNTKKINKRFVPTSGYDARAVGLACFDGKELSIIIENGAPRLNTMMTIAHELTHIWQYQNWDLKEIKKKY